MRNAVPNPAAGNIVYSSLVTSETILTAPRLARRFLTFFCLFTLVTVAAAQTLAPTSKPLPFDEGERGLKQQLRKLQTTGRLLEITAHPDDEDGDVLAMMARGRGHSVTLLTITRGEGGQNRLGNALFDALGVLRTLELLESDKYYGVEQRFTRMADFGFSKSPQETLQKWGHDAALADIVRVIREIQPDVVVAKFAGDERDGHGHHQASAILAREAFRAAGDPTRFPEHMKEGLRPWQAKKFYMRGFAEDHTLEYDTNVMDPVIGMTYAQLHIEGLKHQQSQLSGNFNIPPGPRMRYYKLVDSTLPDVKPGTKEKDFFEGIDTSLSALVPPQNMERKYLSDAQQFAADAARALDRGERDHALKSLADAAGRFYIIWGTLYFPSATIAKEGLDKNALHRAITTAQEKIDASEAAMADFSDPNVTIAIKGAQQGNRFATVTPGSSFNLSVTWTETRPKIAASVILPEGWVAERLNGVSAHPVIQVPHDSPSCAPETGQKSCEFKVSVPAGAEITRQHWERDNPETDTRYRVSKPDNISLPLPDLPVFVRYSYALGFHYR
jgi:LmbE family N-acetylglucosaminyl deacetylase